MTTVPDTLSPGVKVLDGLLSFISKTVDDIVTLRENINEIFMTPVSCFRMAVVGVSFATKKMRYKSGLCKHACDVML